MNYIKSLSVFVALLILVAYAGYLVLRCILCSHHYTLSQSRVAITVMVCVLVIIVVCVFGEYTYPFNRELKPELIAVVQVDLEDAPCGINGSYEWHAVYEEYGLYAESRSWRHRWYAQKYANQWPEMDLDQYTYIITYCQEIDYLSFNVWDTIDIPIYTGAKKGYMKLSDNLIPTNIYIYRIPKMRIDNDAF